MSAFKETSPGSRLRLMPRWRLGRKVFVSYRRADTQEIAERLYEGLARYFGAADVFMDRADIEHGQRWRDEVMRQIAVADMFIVLIGPTWLETLKARAAADDVLRTELTSALEQKKQVIPVLVGGAVMPSAEDLPPDMRGLTEFQALPISVENMDRALLSLLGRVKPGWRLAVSWGFGQLFGWLAGLAILLVAAGLYGWLDGASTARFAAQYPVIAAALAGALVGGCVGLPQSLLLKPWFGRTRYLVASYVVLTAIAAGYAASGQDDESIRVVGGLMMIFLPVAFAVVLWWIVSEKLVHAAWWSAANLLGPVIAMSVAAAARGDDEAASASVGGSKVTEGLSVLADFFLPMILMSLASGALLVWLMRRSEIRRR